MTVLDQASGPDFRRLLAQKAWFELTAAVRARFDHPAASRAYPGSMAVRASAFGWLLAQVCRLVGTPVAPWVGEAVPVNVRVWVDGDGALVWDRTYVFGGRGPILVTSRKLMNHKGELLEIARGGLGMKLLASVEDGALCFRSTHYFWMLRGIEIAIPSLATPGQAEVIHRDVGGGRFTFSMRFVHPWAGETLFQSGTFEDPRP